MNYNDPEPPPYEIKARTFEFSRQVIRLYMLLNEKPGVGKVLSTQLLRSATSIGANLEEAQAGQSKPDFIHKCSISLKEARETHYWLRLLEAEAIVAPQQIAPLSRECNELISILTAITRSAKKG